MNSFQKRLLPYPAFNPVALEAFAVELDAIRPRTSSAQFLSRDIRACIAAS